MVIWAIEHFHARFDLPALVRRFPSTRLAITTPDIRQALEKLGLDPALVAKPDNAESVVNGIAAAEH